LENTQHTAIPEWCPILKVNEALQLMAVDMAVVRVNVTEIKGDVAEVKAHGVVQNHRTEKVEAEQLKAQGAMGMLKWMIATLMAMVSIGVAIAGTMLARGG
jgi:hypothetical protein